MTGFLARVVARASGREDSLAPRPGYRSDTRPLTLRDLPSPPAVLRKLPIVSLETSEVPFDRAVAMEAPLPPGDVDASHHSAAVTASTRVRGAARSMPQDAAPQASFHSDADANLEPGVRHGLDRARDVPNGLFGPWNSGDDAEARLMPLVPVGAWTAAQPALDVSPRHASRVALSANHHPAAMPPRARAERIQPDATPAALEPPTIHVHIGRIDVRAAHPAAPAPPAPPKSRLQRPTLEAYLRSRERGRS